MSLCYVAACQVVGCGSSDSPSANGAGGQVHIAMPDSGGQGGASADDAGGQGGTGGDDASAGSGGATGGTGGTSGSAGSAGSGGSGNAGGTAGDDAGANDAQADAAEDSPGIDAEDGAASDAGEDSAVEANAPDATPDAGDGASDDSSVDGGDPLCHPVLNEIMTGGAAGGLDEFVEVLNPCLTPVDLTGWKLIYRSAAGASDVVLFSYQGSLPAQGYSLMVGSTYSLAATPDGTMTSGLAALGGGLALRDPQSQIVDSLGWGSATNVFIEGTVAPAPAAGSSIARTPNGSDTDNNSVDFVVGVPTPKAPN